MAALGWPHQREDKVGNRPGVRDSRDVGQVSSLTCRSTGRNSDKRMDGFGDALTLGKHKDWESSGRVMHPVLLLQVCMCTGHTCLRKPQSTAKAHVSRQAQANQARVLLN